MDRVFILRGRPSSMSTMSQATVDNVKRVSDPSELSFFKPKLPIDVTAVGAVLKGLGTVLKQNQLPRSQLEEYQQDVLKYQVEMVEYREAVAADRKIHIERLKILMAQASPTYRNLQVYIKYLDEICKLGRRILFSNIDHAKKKNEKLKRFIDTLREGIQAAWPHWGRGEKRHPMCYDAEKIFYEMDAYSLVASNKIVAWREILPGQALLDAITAKCQKVSLLPLDPEFEKMEDLNGQEGWEGVWQRREVAEGVVEEGEGTTEEGERTIEEVGKKKSEKGEGAVEVGGKEKSEKGEGTTDEGGKEQKVEKGRKKGKNGKNGGNRNR